MEQMPTHDAAACPPHHWMIGNEITPEGTFERWSCQRCSESRERLVSRRRLIAEGDRRYVGEEDGPITTFLGRSGERVA
jgi:hypothetical protein